MKRSNRLILLIGFALAIVTFAGIFVILQNGQQQAGTPQPTPATTANIVVAAQDIAIGTAITTEMVTTKVVDKISVPVDSYALPEVVIGKVVRTVVKKDSYISQATFSDVSSRDDLSALLPPGMRAMAVAVSQVSGVGTLIKPGDRVDLVFGIAGLTNFPVNQVQSSTSSGSSSSQGGATAVNPASTKDIVQNVQVLGVLCTASSATAAAAAAAAAPAPSGAPVVQAGCRETTLSNPDGYVYDQVVILAVTAQQAEVVRFAGMVGTDDKTSAGSGFHLVLRSLADASAPPDDTTGITLRQLVDKWALLPPQIVETVLPK